MEMEDHNHHHHNQYNIDLRQFISGRPTHYPTPPPPPLPVDIFSRNHHNQQLPLHAHYHYDMMMLMPRSSGAAGGLHEFHSDSTSSAAAGVASCVPPPPPPPLPSLLPSVTSTSNSASTTVAAAGCSTPTTLCALDADAGSFGGGGDGGTGRWPRQETLTLLEIRSRLDLKFKEANQKGPLWDEVSRIMSEEHGYQRSGKKCREKFENLYKYYKKTKEGKAGRQDGKHYRFFRQLEALYGETSNPCSIPESQFGGSSVRFHTGINTSIQANQESFHSHKLCDSLSLSNSSEFETCSSEDNDLSTATLLENDSSEKRRKRKSWKAKIKDFIDSQMRKLIERQETWLEKLTRTLEQKEQERIVREEEWRKQEAARVEKEHKFWAKERAWIEARDATLMDTLRKLTGRESSPDHHQVLMGLRTENPNDNESDQTMHKSINWDDSEITRLVQLRSSVEPRFHQCGSIEEEESLWKEIARKMGYEKNPLMCKDKWDSISNYNRKTKDIISNKKRKENSCYFQTNYTGSYCEQGEETGNSTNAVNHESCFPFLISDAGGENLWENYGLKLTKGEDQN